MLTPQEVSERSFARAAFNGYNMTQVDEFLDVLTQDYTALYNENAKLKSMLKVLADTVEEYRSTEDGMRRALRAAQRQSEELVEEARQEKERIIQEAKEDARQKIEQVHQALATEEFRLKQAQEATAAFVAQVQALNAKQNEYLATIGELCPPADNAAKVEETAAAIDSSMQHILAQEAPQQPQDLSATTQFEAVAPAAPVEEEAQEQAQEQPQEQVEEPTAVLPLHEITAEEKPAEEAPAEEKPVEEAPAEEPKPAYSFQFLPFKQEDRE